MGSKFCPVCIFVPLGFSIVQGKILRVAPVKNLSTPMVDDDSLVGVEANL